MRGKIKLWISLTLCVAAGTVMAAGLGPQSYAQDGLVTQFDALDNEELGGVIVKVMKVRVTCGIKNNIISFFAQLKGGKSFGVTPVMPKDP